ncbi:MAG: glutathione S-transferase family protein [Sandaracinaceae bacterium]
MTKLVNYMTMTGLEYELVAQDLAKLDDDAPHGKLPYIIDEDGTKVGDSNAIINYFKEKYGDPLDQDQTAEEAAQALAWNRLLEEHVYWSGVIQPRWREDKGWETYIPYIVSGAEVGPELRAALDAFRGRIVAEFDGQGMGRRSDEEVFDVFKQDIDALSSFLGNKTWFMGDKPRSIDASVYSFIRHTADVPFEWPGKPYIRDKKNLTAYANRFHETYHI